MKRKILVKYNKGNQSVAILEEGIFVEYLNQKANESVRGTILVGLVKEYQPSLDAYFIDVGTDLKGFLPEKFAGKTLKVGTQLILQVVKPAYMDKGMTLSSVVSVSGKYCVITSNSEKLRVSAKIKEKSESERLIEIAINNCPQDLGLIIRTNANGQSDEIIAEDISNTAKLYKKIIATSGSPGETIFKPEGIIDDVMRNFNGEDDIVYFDDMDM
ncbi:MAG: ribonuclease E/G, partial [Clostridiales bacterium]|nr:ribonuclease E/G [Clostridiales bacterium]